VSKKLILAPGEREDDTIELLVTTFKGFDRTGYVDPDDLKIQHQRRIGAAFALREAAKEMEARAAMYGAIDPRTPDVGVTPDRRLRYAAKMLEALAAEWEKSEA
jgi:hypothetical protein